MGVSLVAFEKRVKKDIMRARVRGASRSEVRLILKRTEREVHRILRSVFHKTK
jgi:hypothetical protein